MPRGYLSREEQVIQRMISWALGEKKRLHMSDADLAEADGRISRSAWSRKFRERSFSFEDFSVLVRLFQPDDDTLRHITGND